MKLIPFILLPFFLYTGCNRFSEIDKIISDAEVVVMEHPDSALEMLDKIERVSLRPGEQKAKFSLIYAIAQHKNYIDSDSDSLTSIALSYYRDNGSNREKALAYLYHAMTKFYADNLDETISYVAQAAVYTELTDNHNTSGQIYHLLSKCYREQQHYELGIEYARKAQEQYAKAGTIKNELLTIYDIGYLYFVQNMYKEAFPYFTKAKELSKQLSDEEKYIRSMMMLENLTSRIGTEDVNYSAHKELCDFYEDREGTEAYYSVFSMYYYNIRQLDSAKYYYELYLNSLKKVSEFNVHRFMAMRTVCEKLGDYKSALKYEKMFSYYSDSIYKVNLNNLTKEAEQKYHTKYIQDTYDALKSRHVYMILAYSLIFVIVCVLVIILVHRYKSMIKRRTEEFHDYIEDARTQMNEMENRYNSLEKDSSLSREKIIHLQSLLKNRIQSLIQLTEFAHIYESRPKLFYDAFRQELMTNSKLNPEFISEILLITDECFNGVITFLRTKYPTLSNQELCFCALIFLGFNQESIRVLMNHTSVQSLYNIRRKIRSKLDISNDDGNLVKYLQQLLEQFRTNPGL